MTVALAVGGGGDVGPVLGTVTRSLILGFGFGLHGSIDVVVATLASWNKVYSASPYLVNVFGVGEEAMRVGVVRLFGFLWILTVGVSFKGSCLLVYGGTSPIASFVWIYNKVMFLQPSGLVVEDCKSALLLGVCPQPMFYLRLFDLIVRGGWLLRFLKPWLVTTYAAGPILCCLFSVFFKFR